MRSLSRDSWFVFFALALWGFGEGLYFYIQPLYMKRLGANPVEIGALLAAGALAATLSYVPGGMAADRIGRRRVMLGGWILGTAGVFLLAMAQEWIHLVPGLILYGVSGFCLPAITAYVTHAETSNARGLATDNDLGRALTTVWAAYPAGQILSPAIGGAMAQALGMRNVFLVACGVYTLSTLLLSQIADQPVEPRPQDGGDHRRLLRNRPFLLLSGLFLLIFVALYLGQPLAPNYLEEVAGLPLGRIGALGSAASLGAAVLAMILGRLPASNRVRLAAGQALVLLSFALLLSSRALVILALAFFLRGAWNATRALASAELAVHLEPSNLGLGYGVLNSIVGLATMVAPYTAGWLYAARADLPFLVALVGTGGTIVLTLLVLPGGSQSPRSAGAEAG